MVRNIDHLNLSVRNFEESASWYSRIFGFNVVEQGTYDGRPWGVLRSHDAMLCIYEDPIRSLIDGDELERRRLHGFNHFALRITDREAWESSIMREKIAIRYGGPVKWPNSTSWYVNDPTGYEIEVALWHTGSPDFSTAVIQSGIKS